MILPEKFLSKRLLPYAGPDEPALSYFYKEGERMTERQKRFCEYYIQSGNASDAAIKAGYSEKTAGQIGEQNLKKVEIKQYIDEKLEELQSERIASAKEVLEHLTAAMRGQIEEETVIVEGSGDGCSEARILNKQLSARDRIKAAELLGKRYRLFVEKVDVTGSVPVKIIDDIGDDEDEAE